MSAQTSYNQKMDVGVAGGLYDLTEHAIDTRNNEAADGTLKFGFGVVEGTAPGKNVKLPVAASTKADFEGVVINSHAHEQDYKGDVSLRKGETVGVITNGRVYVRLASEIEPSYGDPLYLIKSGDEAGYFANAEQSEGESSNKVVTTIKLNGYFLGGKATGAVAPVYVNVDKKAD